MDTATAEKIAPQFWSAGRLAQETGVTVPRIRALVKPAYFQDNIDFYDAAANLSLTAWKREQEQSK
jgi:hypothetical protein